MTGRAIEDWLTKASERSYQAAFCHLLNAIGYSVLHSTTHGPAEEGKDIIAKDSRKRVYAIQLKRGNINVSDWRTMKSEIEELTELPIRHPSVKVGTKHVPLLVTTGYVNENVASRIDGMNKHLAARGFRQLRTWVGSELLMNFLNHTGGFLPQPLSDFHRLLGFMIGDGSKLLDKSEFDLLLRSVLPVENGSGSLTKNNIIRCITASTIITEYALAGYDRRGNSYAKMEAYVMLFCYIRALAIQYRLPEKYWRASVQLLESAIDDCVRRLVEELSSSGGFGPGDPFTEPVIAPYRNTLLAGVLAAHGIWHTLGGSSEWYADSKHEVIEAVLGLSKKIAVPSEAFIPASFLASTYLRESGHVKVGENIFSQLLRISILRKQDKSNVAPLWNVYLPLEEAILREQGKEQDAAFPDRWETETSTAYPLILVAATRLMRHQLQSLWYAITRLHFTEFVPCKAYQGLFWRNTKGTMLQKMACQPHSWRDLLQEASASAKLPYYFKGYEHWIPHYLMVYPHRFTPSLILALCGLTRSGLQTTED